MALADIPRILVPWNPPGAKRGWFVYPIRTRGPQAGSLRDTLIAGLRTRGIACQSYFPAVHLQPYFRKIPWSPRRPLPHTEIAAQRCLALPFYADISPEQVSEVCSAVREIVAEAERRLGNPDDLREEIARAASG